jgi:hypothetical protein
VVSGYRFRIYPNPINDTLNGTVSERPYKEQIRYLMLLILTVCSINQTKFCPKVEVRYRYLINGLAFPSFSLVVSIHRPAVRYTMQCLFP